MKKIICMTAVIGAILSISGCGSREITSAADGVTGMSSREPGTKEESKYNSENKNEQTFQATVTKMDDTTILVTPVKGSEELRSSDSICVAKKNLPQNVDINTGDIIEISYDGMIQETYPARLGDIYDIRLVKHTDKIYAEGSDGKFGLAIPEGWTYEIFGEEESEELFGKYGIHFYPEGKENGYIEVSFWENFGVCATGLVRQEISLAGDNAVAGYYNGNENWDFIIYQGKNEKIVAQQYQAEEWFTENKDVIMNILDSLEYYSEMEL